METGLKTQLKRNLAFVFLSNFKRKKVLNIHVADKID